MNREQITPSHRSRLAYVYIRQSSPRQVRENLESQKRQRALVHHAVDLGWPRQQVVEVDEDLGVSAARTSRTRVGFQDMVADVRWGRSAWSSRSKPLVSPAVRWCVRGASHSRAKSKSEWMTDTWVVRRRGCIPDEQATPDAFDTVSRIGELVERIRKGAPVAP